MRRHLLPTIVLICLVAAGAVWFFAQSDRLNAELAQADISDAPRYASMTPEVRTLLRQARQGDLQAQHDLGKCYLNGQGVTPDEAEAARWMKSAAKGGHAMSQMAYGMKLALDPQSPEEIKEARQWLEKSAGQGDPKIQGLVYFIYLNSELKDPKRAVFGFENQPNKVARDRRRPLDESCPVEFQASKRTPKKLEGGCARPPNRDTRTPSSCSAPCITEGKVSPRTRTRPPNG